MNMKSSCYPLDLLIVIIFLAFIDGVLAFVAFSQLTRIHVRNQQVGWTRQKVIQHILYLQLLPLVMGGFAGLMHAVSSSWLFPKFCFLLHFYFFYLSAILALHMEDEGMLRIQANDDDDDDGENSNHQPLLDSSKSTPNSSHGDGHWRCFSFHSIHIGSRQKFVTVVVMVIFILMVLFAVIIWFGAGKNPIDSLAVAQVYVDLFSIAILILGGALGCYGLLLFLKSRRVRCANASCETRKIAGLTVVSVICFISSATVALLTDIPLFYQWNLKKLNDVKVLSLLVLYCFLGSSVPSAYVLWIMRELPTPMANDRRVQSSLIIFISHMAEGTQDSGRWVTATSSRNQALKASPI